MCIVTLGSRAAATRDPGYWLLVLSTALATQFAATALMLAAMGERSFVVTIAYIKTEPVQVALFGTGAARRSGNSGRCAALAILIATGGVVLMSIKNRVR